jgi:alginate O-acetyltransferase complex protein AlgI
VLPFRNATALCFSVLFYLWGEGMFIAVLFASVAINYASGILIDRAQQAHLRRRYLAAGITANLALLFYFKYFGFFVIDVLGLPSVTPAEVPLLPLGISFFTFQSMSYLWDVYRRDAKCERSFWNLALYIMMFPQLIAGPIVRYKTIARQIRKRVVHYNYVRLGLWFFSIGLSQKVLIANSAGETADRLFALPLDQISTVFAWLATISYTLQIYFDFAGYSNMAIGLGLIMGFKFPRNFNYPYISQSVTEFWRRWHISLSSWFRDYVYIPLGGNRKGPVSTYFNLLVVFFLCGLWHGAAWSFVAWGMYHGLLLILERAGLSRCLSVLPRIFRHAYTMLAVMFGWVFFRSESLEQAMVFLKQLVGLGASAKDPPVVVEILSHQQMAVMAFGLIAATPVISRFFEYLAVDVSLAAINRGRTLRLYQHIAIMTVSLVLLYVNASYIASGTYNPFIYFRF